MNERTLNPIPTLSAAFSSLLKGMLSDVTRIEQEWFTSSVGKSFVSYSSTPGLGILKSLVRFRS